MKKVTLLLALSAFATAAFAQTTPTTEVKVRDNGTVKATTKTGRTDAGQVLHDSKVATKHAAKNTGHAIKKGARKVKNAVE
ncbi:MAG: hypothetical protein NVS3B25_26850 [Hymenobacter sp.]